MNDAYKLRTIFWEPAYFTEALLSRPSLQKCWRLTTCCSVQTFASISVFSIFICMANPTKMPDGKKNSHVSKRSIVTFDKCNPLYFISELFVRRANKNYAFNAYVGIFFRICWTIDCCFRKQKLNHNVEKCNTIWFALVEWLKCQGYNWSSSILLTLWEYLIDWAQLM